MKSPADFKFKRTMSASREVKVTNAGARSHMLSQASDTAPTASLQLANDDELLSSLKRKISDSAVDYPRRRATIAVSKHSPYTAAASFYATHTHVNVCR